MKQKLTHSRMASFKACRRRHWWEYEVGLRRQTDARALRVGTAVHTGLDVLKGGFGLPEAIEAIGDLYVDVPDSADPYDWSIEQETIEALVAGYEWRWRLAPLVVEATEQVFRLPLPNPETGASSTVWDVAGRIDGIVQVEDGRLAVLEHKTTSDSLDPDSDYWRRLQLDHQITLYVWAARQLGYQIETVLYDVIRKPSIRPEQVPLLDADGLKIVLDANGERVMTIQGRPRQTGDRALGYTLQSRPMTPEEWGHKLLGDIYQRPEYYYARVEIARLDSDIADFIDELWDIQKILRDAQSRGRWYKTVSRDTCSYCPYFGLCSSKHDPAKVPEGFVKITNVNPELE